MRGFQKMKREIIKSFSCAFRGIFVCAAKERNFRIHIIAIVYVTVFSLLYELPKEKYILLLLIFTLVVFAELVNTAVETAVNIHVKHYDRLAKNAKDVAAGAVLVTAITAVITAFLMFCNVEKLTAAFDNFKSTPIIFIPLIISVPLAILFIKGIKFRK